MIGERNAFGLAAHHGHMHGRGALFAFALESCAALSFRAGLARADAAGLEVAMAQMAGRGIRSPHLATHEELLADHDAAVQAVALHAFNGAVLRVFQQVLEGAHNTVGTHAYAGRHMHAVGDTPCSHGMCHARVSAPRGRSEGQTPAP